jgi:hypothetical protein
MYGKLPKCQSFGIDPTIDKLHGYDTIKKSPKERDNNVCNYTLNFCLILLMKLFYYEFMSWLTGCRFRRRYAASVADARFKD